METRQPLTTRLRHAWAILTGRLIVVVHAVDHDLIDFHQSYRSKLMALVDEFNTYVATANADRAAKDAQDAANVAALATANAQIATLQADATATSAVIANATAALAPPA